MKGINCLHTSEDALEIFFSAIFFLQVYNLNPAKKQFFWSKFSYEVENQFVLCLSFSVDFNVFVCLGEDIIWEFFLIPITGIFFLQTVDK